MNCLSLRIDAPATMSIAYSTSIGSMSVDAVRDNVLISTSTVQTAKFTFGLVCGADMGAMILCSSDGILITIDGHYLIVKR